MRLRMTSAPSAIGLEASSPQAARQRLHRGEGNPVEAASSYFIASFSPDST